MFVVSVSCWFAGQCLVSVCGVGESCRGQCVMLVLCTVSVFHRFVVQRVLLWSMCHVGSLYGQCLSSVCGAESPVMVSVSCWFSARSVSFIGLWCRKSCYGQCVVWWSCSASRWFSCQCLSSVCGQRALSWSLSFWLWSVCHIVVMQCVMLVLWSVSCVGLWCQRVL